MATLPCLGLPSMHHCLLLVLLVTCLCHVTQGARVLLLPFPDTSQCRQLVSIGRELKSRGHQVMLFVPDYFRVRRCTEPAPHSGKPDVEIVTFDTDEEDAEMVESKLDRLGYEVMGGGTGLLGGSASARAAVKEICHSLMDARDDLDKLRRGGRIDLVLLDGSPHAHCLTLLPAYIGSAFVAVGSYIRPYDSATPLPTSFYPAPLSGLPANLGFFQRLSNFFAYLSEAYDGELWGGFHQGNDLGPRVSHLDYRQLIKKAVLFLENSDYVVDYPKATFPNLVQVGGLTAGPAGPLPGPLAKFFDESGEAGVVVVSLGPHVFTPNKNLEDKLVSTFRKLDARVLLRLNASRAVRRAQNVQTVSWFPQNDALGHPNTRLFVSHCGKNSFFEALRHGVPVLCCHFAGSDVLGTGLRVAEYGVGLSLDLLAASTDSLKTAVNTLLTDKSFSRRAKAASRLFQSRPETPDQRAASAIEHVLKFGGGYLRPRVVEMSFFQYAGLDIALTLFSVLFAVAGLVCVFLFKKLSGTKEDDKTEKDGTVPVSDNTTLESNPKPVTKSSVTQPQSTVVSKLIMYGCLALIIIFYIFV